MFTRITFAAVAVLALAITVFSTGDAIAGKGGHNAGASYISLSSGDGTTTFASVEPRLGSSVRFDSYAAGLAGWEYPMIAVWCYQGSVLVYMQLAHPDEAFVLGGGSSDWLLAGGSADCEAYLYAYGTKGGRESIRALAGTTFFAAAP